MVEQNHRDSAQDEISQHLMPRSTIRRRSKRYSPYRYQPKPAREPSLPDSVMVTVANRRAFEVLDTSRNRHRCMPFRRLASHSCPAAASPQQIFPFSSKEFTLSRQKKPIKQPLVAGNSARRIPEGQFKVRYKPEWQCLQL